MADKFVCLMKWIAVPIFDSKLFAQNQSGPSYLVDQMWR